MDKKMKKDLETVVNAVINEDTDKAVSAFKSYLKEKTKEILESDRDCDDSDNDGECDNGEFDEDEFDDDYDSDMKDYDDYLNDQDAAKYGHPDDPDYSGPLSKNWVGH